MTPEQFKSIRVWLIAIYCALLLNFVALCGVAGLVARHGLGER